MDAFLLLFCAFNILTSSFCVSHSFDSSDLVLNTIEMSSNPRVSTSPALSSEGTSSQDEESHAESLEQELPFFAIPPHPPSGTTLNDLLDHAMDRILTYEVTQRGLKVRSLLMGLLDWLPENGQRFLANLLCISLTDDFDAIYQHIYTHLCVASKFTRSTHLLTLIDAPPPSPTPPRCPPPHFEAQP